MELWKSCEVNTSYEVSTLGNVRSIDRVILRKDGQTRRYKGKAMSQNADKYGYSNVYLSQGGKDTRVRVHRLVAIAFIPNPDNKPEVNHKDGVKSNNKHAVAMGLSIHKAGTEARRFTGSVQAFNEDGELVATMSGNKEMKEHGFDFRLVSAVLMGKRKSHKDCTFVKLEREDNDT